MTVEAKLRISADLKDARAQVKSFEADIIAAKQAGTDKTDRGAFEGLRTGLRQAKEATRELQLAQVAQQKTANKSLIQNLQLSAQLQDFFVQVQAGGSPLTAFIQQGSQLSFIYGGAGNALKAVTSLFTPLRIAAGGAAAGIGLLAAAYLGGEKQSNDFARSLQITGGFAGITAGQFEDMAARVSRSVDSSIGGAKETIQGLVSTGKFTSNTLEPVATAIEKVAELTGQTREDVIKDFSAMAEGGVVKFAEKLNSSYNFLDLATYKYIKTLKDQGRESEAQILLMTKLNQGLGDTQKNLTSLERAWKSIGKAASEAWDAFLGIGRTETIEERIATAEQVLLLARERVATRALSTRADGGRAGQRKIDDAQARLDALKESKRLSDRATLQVASVKETNKAEIAEQIKKDKEVGKNQLTRLAQTRQLFDAELELANDANQRELRSLQDKYNNGLVTLEAYLARKAALLETDAAQDIARLQAQLKAEQATLAANEPRLAQARKTGDKNGIEQAEESILASKQKIEKLETDITKRKRDQLDATAALMVEEKKITDEISKQFAAFEVQARQANGQRSTPEQARAEARVRYQALYDRLGVVGDTGGQEVINRQVERDARQIRFEQVARELEQRNADLQVREQALRLADEQAGISSIETERKIIALRSENIAKVRELTDELAGLADLPANQTRVAQAQLELERMKDTTTELERTARTAGANGFGQMFSDIATGAKTAEQALSDMLGSFVRQMLDVITQELGRDLIQSLFPKGGGGGGAGGGDILGSFIATLGFHSGGVVRPGGQTFTRSIPAGLAMAAAQYAPRYHSGGMAGFKPNERLAVLETGEEVLTADNPRHINNMRSRGGVSVENKFVINGANGDDAQKQTALNDLSGQMEVLIDQWSMKQQRPGGILFKGGR